MVGEVTFEPAAPRVTITSHVPGLVVVTYEVIKGDVKDIRRLVIAVG